MSWSPQSARTEELAPAFRLLFSHLAADERDKRVSNALILTQRGELNPDGVLVLRGDGGLVGALVCLPLVGATALLWPPCCVEDQFAHANEDQLLRHGLAWLRSQSVKIVQALLSVEENERGASLLRNGFR